MSEETNENQFPPMMMGNIPGEDPGRTVSEDWGGLIKVNTYSDMKSSEGYYNVALVPESTREMFWAVTRLSKNSSIYVLPEHQDRMREVLSWYRLHHSKQLDEQIGKGNKVYQFDVVRINHETGEKMDLLAYAIKCPDKGGVESGILPVYKGHVVCTSSKQVRIKMERMVEDNSLSFYIKHNMAPTVSRIAKEKDIDVFTEQTPEVPFDGGTEKQRLRIVRSVNYEEHRKDKEQAELLSKVTKGGL